MLRGLTARMNEVTENLLQELLVRAEAESVYLCNRGGCILNTVSVNPSAQDDTIAALAAGSFFATREIALLVGEPEFRCVVHQGNRKGLFMQVTGQDLLLVVVFDGRTNPGLVKLYAAESCQALDDCFAAATGEDEALAASLQSVEVDPAAGFFAPRQER